MFNHIVKARKISNIKEISIRLPINLKRLIELVTSIMSSYFFLLEKQRKHSGENLSSQCSGQGSFPEHSITFRFRIFFQSACSSSQGSPPGSIFWAPPSKTYTPNFQFELETENNRSLLKVYCSQTACIR